jgi:hypothetical protein
LLHNFGLAKFCLSKTEAQADKAKLLKETAIQLLAYSDNILKNLGEKYEDLANVHSTACASMAVLHTLIPLLRELGQSADAQDLAENRLCSCRTTIQMIDKLNRLRNDRNAVGAAAA